MNSLPCRLHIVVPKKEKDTPTLMDTGTCITKNILSLCNLKTLFLNHTLLCYSIQYFLL